MDHLSPLLLVGALTAGTVGALLGPLLAAAFTAFQQLIRSCLDMLVSIVAKTLDLSGVDFRNAVLGMLAQGRPAPKGDSTNKFGFVRTFVRPLGEYRDIVSFNLGGNALFELYWYRHAPLLYVYVDGKPDRLMYLRGTVDRLALLHEAEEWAAVQLRDAEQTSRFKVMKLFGSLRAPPKGAAPTEEVLSKASRSASYGKSVALFWKPEDLGADVDGVRVEDLSLTNAQRNVVRRVRFWFSRRGWYRQRGLAWRIGCLFYGLPGTGKTTLIRALGEELGIPIYVFDLGSMSNDQFQSAWETVRGQGTRIVLFEDFDAVFHQRQNVSGVEGGLTFDVLLNVLDGVEREDGLMLAVTTNHVEHLDPAMGVPDPSGRSTRPGRINLILEFVALDEAGRRKVAERILDTPEDVERMVRQGVGDSADQFTERCSKEAVDLMWTSQQQEAA